MTADLVLATALDLLLRSTLILLPVLLFARFARRASAATRHLVCLAGLVAVIALPALSLAGPRIRLGLKPAPRAAVATPAPIETAGLPDSPAAESLLVIGLWALGTGLLAIRIVRDLASVATLCRQGRAIAETSVKERLESAAREIGLARIPRLRVHPEVEVPVTWGLYRSAVLLPEKALTWSPSRLRAVFLHELSHVKRRDCLTQLVADLACAAFWFQPLAWLAARRMREEREAACDDPVLLRGARPSGYATLLLRMLAALRSRGNVSASSAAFGEGSGLERRLCAMLGSERSRRAPRAATVVAFLVGGLTVALFVAALDPESAPETPTVEVANRADVPEAPAARVIRAVVPEPPVAEFLRGDGSALPCRPAGFCRSFRVANYLSVRIEARVIPGR